jgi:O-antigen/teichoic acid export membrane protein
MQEEQKGKKDDSARTLGVKAAKGTLIYTIGNIVGSLMVLLLLIILARLLSPSDFGLYAIAIAFYNILSGHFVFGTVIRKDIPQAKEKERVAELISNGYFLSLVVAFAVSIVAMLASNFIAINVYHNAAMTGSLVLASALVFLYALFNLTLAILIAIEKVKEGTIIYLLYASIQLVAGVALVLAGYGVFGAIVGLGIGLVIPSIIGICLIAKHIGSRFAKPDKKTLKHMVDFSVPVLASNVATYVPPNLAILLLGVYATSLTVGNYNAAFRFGSFVSVILVSISFVLLPAFAKAFSDRDLSSKIGKIYNNSIYYTLLLLLPVVIYVVSVSQPLLYLLFSSRYSFAPFYFVIIALGSTVGIISTYAGNLIVGYGDTKRFMYYQLLAVAIQVILLFALVPMFGADGALLALFVISQILMDIIFVYALYKQFSFKQHFMPVLRLAIPTAILIILLSYFTLFLNNSKWSLITNLVAILVIFPPLAVLFGAVKRENLDFLKDIAKSLKAGKALDYMIRYTELFMGSGKGQRNGRQ